jgi:hypothetical protein
LNVPHGSTPNAQPLPITACDRAQRAVAARADHRAAACLREFDRALRRGAELRRIVDEHQLVLAVRLAERVRDQCSRGLALLAARAGIHHDHERRARVHLPGFAVRRDGRWTGVGGHRVDSARAG